ncbi:hypothetical protein [Yaniella halotolerans]|uniref:hypothetical protein n=1 Tax=Yaniella halotolerans TaxID=225453 RepID=UPI0003B61E49|nr:hypothetical protein [Yaniella halotolerans]
MTRRDMLFFGLGTLVACIGVIASLLGSKIIGIVATLVIGSLILVLLLLQRKQMAAMQQRTLGILRKVNSGYEIVSALTQPQSEQHLSKKEVGEALQVPTKKLVGLLQAQQMQIDALSSQIELLDRSRTNSANDQSEL